MGLDTTHNCWAGGYGHFHDFRVKVAKAAGIDLDKMVGFKSRNEEGGVNIEWESLKPDIIHVLLDHPDCEGDIPHAQCKELGDRLMELVDDLPEDYYKDKARQFALGLFDAASRKENVEFQ